MQFLCIDLMSCDLIELILTFCLKVPWDSLQRQSCHLQIEIVIYSFPFGMPLIPFSCLIAIARIFSTVLRIVGVDIITSFLILEGRHSVFSH